MSHFNFFILNFRAFFDCFDLPKLWYSTADFYQNSPHFVNKTHKSYASRFMKMELESFSQTVVSRVFENQQKCQKHLHKILKRFMRSLGHSGLSHSTYGKSELHFNPNSTKLNS